LLKFDSTTGLPPTQNSAKNGGGDRLQNMIALTDMIMLICPFNSIIVRQALAEILISVFWKSFIF